MTHAPRLVQGTSAYCSRCDHLLVLGEDGWRALWSGSLTCTGEPAVIK